MSETFDNHAYDHSIIEYLQRSLLKAIDSDTPATERIICEDVPRSRSEVPQERLVRMLNRLQLEENNERVAMAAIDAARNGIPPFFTQPETKTDEQPEAAPAKPARKPRKA